MYIKTPNKPFMWLQIWNSYIYIYIYMCVCVCVFICHFFYWTYIYIYIYIYRERERERKKGVSNNNKATLLPCAISFQFISNFTYPYPVAYICLKKIELQNNQKQCRFWLVYNICMSSEYCWSTPYFATCTDIYLDMCLRVVIQQYYLYTDSWLYWNTYAGCCNLFFHQYIYIYINYVCYVCCIYVYI